MEWLLQWESGTPGKGELVDDVRPMQQKCDLPNHNKIFIVVQVHNALSD